MEDLEDHEVDDTPDVTPAELAELIVAAAGRAAPRHKFLKQLGTNAECIASFYDPSLRTATLPAAVYKDAFQRKNLDMYQFNRGLAGLADAKAGKGTVVITFNVSGLRGKAQVVAKEEDLTDQFVPDVRQKHFHNNWKGIPGFGVETFCPSGPGEESSKMGRLSGDAPELFATFRQQFNNLEGGDARVAQASATFALQ